MLKQQKNDTDTKIFIDLVKREADIKSIKESIEQIQEPIEIARNTT